MGIVLEIKSLNILPENEDEKTAFRLLFVYRM